jgi:hypothetical protein
MKELNENIVRILEDNGFYVGEPEYSNHHNEYCIEINQSTDLGEDWWITLWYDGTDEDFIQKFETLVENFDPDEEAEVYIEMRGKNGVPDSIRDIINDQEWKLETLRTTLKELQKEFEDCRDYPDTDDEDEEYTITLKLTNNGKTVCVSSNEDPDGEEAEFKTITDRGEQMLIALATYLGYEPSWVLNLEGIEEEEEATENAELWKVFYHGPNEIGAYTLFGEGAGEEQATKELLASERGIDPSEITCYVVER